MTEEVTSAEINVDTSSAPVTEAPAEVVDNASTNVEPVLNNTETVAEDVSKTETTEVKEEVNFLDTIPEEFRGEGCLKTMKSNEDILKAYVNSQKLIGKKISDMSPEELKQINYNRGVPEDKGEYKFDGVKDADPQTLEWFKDVAFENGLTSEQAAKLAEAHASQFVEQQKYMETEIALNMEKNAAKLKTEFGAAYDQNIGLAEKALKEFDGGEFKALIDNAGGLTNNPEITKFLVAAGKNVSEGTLQAPDNQGSFKMTPSEVRTKIEELRNSESYNQRINSRNLSERESARKQMQDLYAMASMRG